MEIFVLSGLWPWGDRDRNDMEQRERKEDNEVKERTAQWERKTFSGLERNKNTVTKNLKWKEEKDWKVFHSPLI